MAAGWRAAPLSGWARPHSPDVKTVLPPPKIPSGRPRLPRASRGASYALAARLVLGAGGSAGRLVFHVRLGALDSHGRPRLLEARLPRRPQRRVARALGDALVVR